MSLHSSALNISRMVNKVKRLNYRREFFNRKAIGNSCFDLLISSSIRTRGMTQEELLSFCESVGFELLLVLEDVELEDLLRHQDRIDWKRVTKTLPLSKRAMLKLSETDLLNWREIICFQDFDQEVVEAYQGNIYFPVLVKRSEERRVGKECRYGGSRGHGKEKSE